MLSLEGAQAGLSWLTLLRKRKNYRTVFDGFNPVKVAGFSDQKLEAILQDPGIVRNRLKVFGTRQNAKAFLAIQQEVGSFDEYIWQFVGGQPSVNTFKTMKSLPSKTKESDAMSKALKSKGFTFVGSTICYAFMQATGMVNDHLIGCSFYTLNGQKADHR
jgi:DNA-3-methyladenine glycosylase I